MRKNINIQKKTQKNGFFCWAACIEMVVSYFNNYEYSGIQIDLNEKLIDLKDTSDEGSIEMPDNTVEKPYYLKLLSEYGISATLNIFEALPNISFVIEKLQITPLIFSGVYHPYTSGSKHAFIIRGYFKDTSPDYDWVLCNDPWPVGLGTKVAWIYKELLLFHNIIQNNLISNKKSKTTVDVLTDFEKNASKPLLSIENIESSWLNYEDNKRGFDASGVQTIIKKLLKSNLTDYFFNYKFNDGVLVNWDARNYFNIDFKVFFGLATTQILSLANLENVLIDKAIPLITRLFFYPIVEQSNDENVIVRLEFIFREITDSEGKNNSFLLMGIQEPMQLYKFQNVNFKVSGTTIKFTFNHQSPNYIILNITPYNLCFMVFEYMTKIYFAPITNGNNSKIGEAFSYTELYEILKNNKF